MTVQNPPIFIQAGSHPAEGVRRWLDSLIDGTPGVVTAADMLVTQKATPNMSVDVAGGRAFIAGTEATYQGSYAVENRGVANVVISASNPTNPRRDLIVARIKDAAYSGALNTFTIEVVTGTAAAVPVDPAVPANCLVLARVTVAALATTVVNANITDLRTRAYALGVAENNARLANLPTLIQSGSISVPGAATTTTTATVTFPLPFGATPNFVCNLSGSGGLFVVTAATVTTTQAPVVVFKIDGTNVVSSRVVQWIASGVPA